MITLSFPVIDEPAWGLNTQLSTYCWGLMGWAATKCLFFFYFFFLKQSRKTVGRNIWVAGLHPCACSSVPASRPYTALVWEGSAHPQCPLLDIKMALPT